jgi:hypothetical protein
LEKCYPSFGTILFENESLAALNAFETAADMVEAGRVVGFEVGPFFEVVFRFGFTAERHVGQAAEIVSARIIGAALDGLRQFVVGTAVIAGEVLMHPVAIVLIENRRILGRQGGTAE